VPEQPGEGQVEDSPAALFRPLLEGFEPVEIPLAQGGGAALAPGRKPCALARGFPAPVLAGQEAAGERKIGQEAQAEALAGRQDLACPPPP